MNKRYSIEVKEVPFKDNDDKKKVEPKKSSFSWMILIFAVIVALIVNPVELNSNINYINPNKQERIYK